MAVPVAEGIRSHAEQALPGWGGLATALHLAAAAIWVGALVHVVRAGVAWRTQRPALVWVVSGYARWAAWLFAVVVVTGTVSTLILVPWSALTTTTYGRTLLIKLALVAVAAAAAVTARRLLRGGIDTMPTVARATRVEAGTLTAVLAVTAVLVSTPSARDTQQFLVPPPPAGVVLPLATLAGQVGVAVAASDGQLVVRLSTPRRGDYYTPGEAPSYRLAASMLTPGGGPREVRLSGCGEGCFVAPVTWGSGENLLTLRVQASGWTGGTVGLVVAWPVTAAPELLARAVEAMKSAGEITVYEAVTSDTSAPWPDPVELHLTGAEFVATEPYSSGVAPQAVVVRADASGSRLAVGFPAEGRYVELVLDPDGRIVEESLADAKHVTRRRFVYPSPR
jgi:copper transport protein